jgi:hypothetical protein
MYAPSIEFAVESTQPSQRDTIMFLLISLRNIEMERSIENVSIRLFQNGSEQRKEVFDKLLAGQAVSVQLPIPRDWTNTFYTIQYKTTNGMQSVTRAFNMPRQINKDSMLPMLIPVLSGLVGAIVGAWVVNFFTNRRERARYQFEWSKMLFEKYEKAYRDFLRNWRGTQSVLVLQTQFSSLQENSIVPRNMINLYDEVVSILKSSTSTQRDKEGACSRLMDGVHEFIKRPWHVD